MNSASQLDLIMQIIRVLRCDFDIAERLAFRAVVNYETANDVELDTPTAELVPELVKLALMERRRTLTEQVSKLTSTIDVITAQIAAHH